jgi:kynurenine formamidase
MGTAVVIDFSDRYGPEVAKSKTISSDDIKEKIAKNNLDINENDIVIINTGWHKIFYSEPIKYYTEFCTLSDDAGMWLKNKKIKMIGIDACDVDEHKYYTKFPYDNPPNHTKNFLPNDIFIIENVGGEIDMVLNKRIYIIAAPLSLSGRFAASSPIRLIGGIL